MNIGKKIGSTVYVHKDYASKVIPTGILAEALKKLTYSEVGRHFNWDYVKFDKSLGTLTFTRVDNFDKKDEPVVLEQIRVSGDVVRKIPQPKDPNIIHGKHLMVAPDYKGFNYQRLKERFDSYQHLDKSRMGKKSWFEKNFLDK